MRLFLSRLNATKPCSISLEYPVSVAETSCSLPSQSDSKKRRFSWPFHSPYIFCFWYSFLPCVCICILLKYIRLSYIDNLVFSFIANLALLLTAAAGAEML